MPRGKANCCPVDEFRFHEVLKERDLKIRKVSTEIGHGSEYLTNRIRRTGAIPKTSALLIQSNYGIDPEEYAPIKKKAKVEKTDAGVAQNVDLSEMNTSLEGIKEKIDSAVEKCMVSYLHESDSYVKKEDLQPIIDAIGYQSEICVKRSDIQTLADAIDRQTEAFEKLQKTINVTCTILQNESEISGQDSQSIIDLLSVISTKLSNI